MPCEGHGDSIFQGKGADLTNQAEKVLVALSGGVDSAVAAFLLHRQGYRVHCMFIKMTGTRQEEAALSSARKISESFGLPFYVVDRQDAFKRTVIEYFTETYQQGLTPNPCVVCNPEIKFGAMAETANRLGIRFLASGHYARIKKNKTGHVFLLKALDEKKDQSYFLHRLKPKQLRTIIMPLGTITRKEVEKIAEEIGIASLIQKESQDVCFLRGDYREFIRHGIDKAVSRPGFIKTTNGTIKGRHKGLFDFTIGQRRGLAIPDATPYYVIRLDVETNTLVIGKEDELFTTSCRITQINWLFRPSKKMLKKNVYVKLRSRHRASRAIVSLDSTDSSRGTIDFLEPQRAVTPGQFAVFYSGPLVIGGGTVCK